MRRLNAGGPGAPRAACRLLLLLGLVAPTGPRLAAQQPNEPPRTIAAWEADSSGTQRAVLQVPTAAPAVRVSVPWRRSDPAPAAIRIMLTDSAGTRLTEVVRAGITPAVGEIAFAPAAGPGRYYLYWLPYAGTMRANYPRITYLPPDERPDPAWLAAHDLGAGSTAESGALAASAAYRRLPEARVVRFESSDAWDRTDAMEWVASAEETAAVAARHATAPFVVFPEDRAHPIRLRRALPVRWTPPAADAPGTPGAAGRVTGTARRGEFFVFQLGVWAHRGARGGLAVLPSPLVGDAGRLPSAAIHPLTLRGKDWRGVPFSRRVDVAAGEVRALWVGVEVPYDARAGEYRGTIVVADSAGGRVAVPLVLAVSADTIHAHGDDDAARLTRLRWLDSDIARDDGLVRPYTAVTVTGRTLGVLGRTVTLGPDGLPAQVTSRFTPAATRADGPPRPLLRAPATLDAVDPAGRPVRWTHGPLAIVRHPPGAVEWRVTSRSGTLARQLRGRLEFDGTIEYEIALVSSEARPLRDVALTIPLRRPAVRWFMGMGRQGGERPEGYEWRWDRLSNQDAAWAGDVHGGLQLLLKDERYVRPLNTNFYTLKPLVLPRSWHNDGAGGCRFGDGDPEAWTMRCFGGPRTLAPSDTLRFDFRLTLTPFRPIDPAAQFRTRFFHAYAPVDSIRRLGANVVNVHHATPVNPWINYPFLEAGRLRAYADSVHAAGMRVKIYYTVRELTTRAPELWALRALDHEVFSPGAGGGGRWLQEHLHDDYISAWHVPEIGDAAIITNGISRWHNHYVEGMDWLARTTGVDGIYIDDVAFDRITMQRVRKVLERRRPDPLIDLHSANQWNRRDGWASSMNLYLEHLPYVDRLWFGEYFDYDSGPGYWLTELSGIPFGVMGEMLEGGGNPWRGMLFGMTNRLPWSGNPRPLWQLFDTLALDRASMQGWWDPGTPVRTGRADVLATSYVRRGGTSLVAVASWASDTVAVPLRIDWAALGLSPRTHRAELVAVSGLQEGRALDLRTPLVVAPRGGALIVIRPAVAPAGRAARDVQFSLPRQSRGSSRVSASAVTAASASPSSAGPVRP